MEKIVQSIKSQPKYYAIILFAGIVSAVYYIYKIKGEKDFKDLIFMAVVNAIVGVLLSTATATAISGALSTGDRYMFSPFGIYYGLVFFTLSAVIMAKVYKKSDFDNYVNSMLVFICLSRLACLYAKCCGGSFPIVQTEILLCCIALVYNAITKKIKYKYFLCGYSVFRFVVEFFKNTYSIEKLWIFTPLQYLAIIVIFVAVYIMFAGQRSKK